MYIAHVRYCLVKLRVNYTHSQYLLLGHNIKCVLCLCVFSQNLEVPSQRLLLAPNILWPVYGCC